MRNQHIIIRTALAILVMGMVLQSCAPDTADGDDSETKIGTDAGTEQKADGEKEDILSNHLPKVDFGGDTITIYHFGNEAQGGNDTSDWNRDGDVVADAVKARDIAVEEALGVTIAYTPGSDDWNEYPEEVEKMIRAVDCPYDIIFLESSQAFRLSLEGYFRNLTDLPYIDVTQPWWYTSFMDGGSVSTEKRLFLTWAFSISTLEGASAMIFNKRLYNTYFESQEELYSWAENHQWTVDRYLQICRDTYHDLNGNGTADAGDLYGMASRGQPTVNYMSMSVGLDYLKRSEDGLPVLDIYNEDSIRWVEKLYTMMHEDNIAYTNYEIEEIEHFASGGALFYPGMLFEYTGKVIRAMEDPYGVLPMPVLDEGMEYMSAAGTVNGQSAVIPTTAKDDRMEICGAVLEAMSIEAYRSVIPAWYEVALKSKHADTERDADMIDIIYNTVDTSFIMNADKLLGTGSFFWEMLGNKKKTPGEFASYYEKHANSLEKKWNKMLDSYAALED